MTITNTRDVHRPKYFPGGQGKESNGCFGKNNRINNFLAYFRRFYVPSTRPIWRRTWFSVLFGIGFLVFFIYLIASLKSGDPFDESDIANEGVHVEFPHM